MLHHRLLLAGASQQISKRISLWLIRLNWLVYAAQKRPKRIAALLIQVQTHRASRLTGLEGRLRWLP